MRLKTTLLFVFLLSLLSAPTLQAQPDNRPPDQDRPPREEMSGERLERVKAVRQAFLTENMELTEEEAAVFFPLFWELERERHQLTRQMRRERPRRPMPEMTEAEARQRLAAIRAERNARHEMEIRYENQFLEAIPARKLLRLEFAEREFRRLLVDRVRGRQGGPEGDRAPRNRNDRQPPRRQ